jgi:hypothetical protein
MKLEFILIKYHVKSRNLVLHTFMCVFFGILVTVLQSSLMELLISFIAGARMYTRERAEGYTYIYRKLSA